MKECKEKLKKRSELIEEKGFNTNERILLDEEIKGIFDNGEALLRSIRQVFKEYQNLNKRKVEQIELENRSRNIDLLRKNLNLLQEEFKMQQNRSKHSMKLSKSKSNAFGHESNGDFIDIFKNVDKKKDKGTGINESDEESSEMELNGDE